MTENIVLSIGWYLSQNPETNTIILNIPEAGYNPNATFKQFDKEQNVWLKICNDITYVLDWQSNARVIYENHLANCNCPNGKCVIVDHIPSGLFDYVMLPFENTREIMTNLCD